MNSTTLVPFSSYRNGGTRPSELESEVSNLFRDIDQLFSTSISRFFRAAQYEVLQEQHKDRGQHSAQESAPNGCAE